MPAGIRELVLDVYEVVREPVQAGRRRPEHGEGGTRALGQECERVVEAGYEGFAFTAGRRQAVGAGRSS